MYLKLTCKLNKNDIFYWLNRLYSDKKGYYKVINIIDKNIYEVKKLDSFDKETDIVFSYNNFDFKIPNKKAAVKLL